MKKSLFFLILVMFFIVSCGDSKKTENDADILPDDDSTNEEAAEPDEENPCDPNPCEGKEYATGECIADEWDKSITCVCDGNHYWNEWKCTNACEGNPCQYEEHAISDSCSLFDTPTAYECDCEEGYHWAYFDCEKENEDIDSSSPNQVKYNSPYGSVSFDFSGYIGSSSYPERGNLLFSGTYGNGSTPILPEDPETVLNFANTTDEYPDDDIRNKYILIQKEFITSDLEYGNPLILFAIPIETASKEGIYNINYDYKDNVSLLILEFDWYSGVGKCVHAFAEGEIEITNSFTDGEYEQLSFRGEAKLYNPLNYKDKDISAIPSISEFFIKFTWTDQICDPVD